MIKKFFYYTGFSLFTTLFGILSLPIITGFLEPSEYGVLGLGLAFVTLLIPINTMSNQQNVQISKTNRLSNEYDLFWNNLCTTTFLFTFICMFFTAIAIYLFELHYIFFIIPILSLFRSLRLLKQAELTVTEKDFLYGFSTLIIAVLSFLATLLVFYYFNVSAAIRVACLAFAEFIVIIVILKIRFSFTFEINGFLSILKFGWPLIISTLPAWLINESSRFYLLKFHDLSLVGVYTLAFQISAIYLQFNTALGNTFVKKIFDNINLIFNRFFILKIIGLQLCCASIFLFSTKYLGVYILPESYFHSLAIANILILGVLFQSFGLLPSYYLSYHKINVYRLYALLLAAIIATVLNYLFIPSYGAVGAAIIFVVAMFSYALVISIFAFCHFKSLINEKGHNN